MELNDLVEWQGRTIACGSAGSGPPVVFCHGTPFSSVVWSRYADALSAEFTVHLWDMPGYGRSSKRPEDAVDFGAQAQALVALLAHWGLDTPDTRPHVIAHDFGGATALRALLGEHAAFASLLLVDPVAIPPIGSPFFRFVQDHPATLDGLPAFAHEAVLRAYIAGASHRGLDEDDLAALLEPWRGADGQPAFYRQVEQFDIGYLEANERELGTLDLPVDVVWGAEDEWIPPQVGQRLVQLVPGAQLTLVPDAGHLVQYDAPVALTAIIRRWLTRQAD